MLTNLQASNPIGIFDSGIGGLTVAHAITELLPKEHLIYFGDTAHLPYGDKSTAAIQAYSVKIAQMLLQQECKLILIACHSASAAAFELVKEYVGNQAIVVNVIDPTIQFLKETYAQQRIGLIGTKQTINSHVYKKKIDSLNLGIKLSTYTTNLLAQAIEEFGDHEVIDALLKVYLASPDLNEIDALVLACTHYPIIKNRISEFYHHQINIIDMSLPVAHEVKYLLSKNELLHHQGMNQKQFYVSDYTESFAANARLFFGEEIKLDHYPLWD